MKVDSRLVKSSCVRLCDMYSSLPRMGHLSGM